MQTKDMQKRIEELERKVRDLEARPVYYPPVYVPVHVYHYPNYPAPFPSPWFVTTSTTAVTT